MRRWAIAVALMLAPAFALADSELLAAGMEAFDRRDYVAAMDAFMAVLRKEPGHPQAHKYVDAITRTLAAQQRQAVERDRLALLEEASSWLPAADGQVLLAAVDQAQRAGEAAGSDRTQTMIEEARLQRDHGHLLAANDLVLQILAKEPSHEEAQRELSELQSRLRAALDHAEALGVDERYAMEGFYAFGQADYASALNAWTKARAVLAGAGGAGRLPSLHFAAYESVARAHVNEAQHAVELKAMFDQAVALLDKRRYGEALDAFRRLAIREPEYPRLATYLVQAESAAEQDRARRLGERKREEVAALLRQGESALEKEQFDEARRAFQRLLAMDPGHSEAQHGLAIVTAELKRRHDPKAAQMHYESGLIAYASGKLEDAAREWRMAARSDPANEKVTVALNKVQKELALSKEEP